MDAFLKAGLDPDVLDTRTIDDWMTSAGLGDGQIHDAQVIGGGTQNILVRFSRADHEYVLRRPPIHLRASSNQVLLREVRILDALAKTSVPAPRLVAACSDETVLGGGVFYLMEPIAGFNAYTELPTLHATDAALRHDMGLAAVRGLAALSTVDYQVVGLSDLDRSGDFPKRQVSRWMRELRGYGEVAGYAGPSLPHLEEVATWLDAQRPNAWRPGIMHGDYHLANLMYSPDGPELAAIVDWEMWTIGDPLLDLGWLLATWPHRDGASVVGGALAAAGNLALPSELIDEYARLTDADLSHLSWYIVLACFKLGILLEGTYARACSGHADADVGTTMHARAVDLFEFAAHTMTSSR
jgi:aminoglycoside phosphotransferase (APT) family kinase protein